MFTSSSLDFLPVVSSLVLPPVPFILFFSCFILPSCPPPLLLAVTWFLLALSREVLSRGAHRAHCSLWLQGRGGPVFSGVSGLVLGRARGAWVGAAPSRLEGAL